MNKKLRMGLLGLAALVGSSASALSQNVPITTYTGTTGSVPVVKTTSYDDAVRDRAAANNSIRELSLSEYSSLSSETPEVQLTPPVTPSVKNQYSINKIMRSVLPESVSLVDATDSHYKTADSRIQNVYPTLGLEDFSNNPNGTLLTAAGLDEILHPTGEPSVGYAVTDDETTTVAFQKSKPVTNSTTSSAKRSAEPGQAAVPWGFLNHNSDVRIVDTDKDGVINGDEVIKGFARSTPHGNISGNDAELYGRLKDLHLEDTFTSDRSASQDFEKLVNANGYSSADLDVNGDNYPDIRLAALSPAYLDSALARAQKDHGSNAQLLNRIDRAVLDVKAHKITTTAQKLSSGVSKFHPGKVVQYARDGDKLKLHKMPPGEIIQLPTRGPVVTYTENKHPSWLGFGQDKTQANVIIPYDSFRDLPCLDINDGGKLANALASGTGAGLGSGNLLVGAGAAVFDGATSYVFDLKKPGVVAYQTGAHAASELTKSATAFRNGRNNMNSFVAYGAIDTDGDGKFETPVTIGIQSTVPLSNVRYHQGICDKAIFSLGKTLGSNARGWAFRAGTSYIAAGGLDCPSNPETVTGSSGSMFEGSAGGDTVKDLYNLVGSAGGRTL